MKYADTIKIEREKIYDEICRTLTDYENEPDMVNEQALYTLLVKIQNNWESVITAKEE